jgi:hypothetical protein
MEADGSTQTKVDPPGDALAEQILEAPAQPPRDEVNVAEVSQANGFDAVIQVDPRRGLSVE